ncbi:hypothetical protein J6590_018205 [Homalodisca vitripennis]|nr:hypothetical protein J6590_018205 [Homalodisca vitripennis]
MIAVDNVQIIILNNKGNGDVNRGAPEGGKRGLVLLKWYRYSSSYSTAIANLVRVLYARNGGNRVTICNSDLYRYELLSSAVIRSHYETSPPWAACHCALKRTVIDCPADRQDGRLLPLSFLLLMGTAADTTEYASNNVVATRRDVLGEATFCVLDGSQRTTGTGSDSSARKEEVRGGGLIYRVLWPGLRRMTYSTRARTCTRPASLHRSIVRRTKSGNNNSGNNNSSSTNSSLCCTIERPCSAFLKVPGDSCCKLLPISDYLYLQVEMTS